MRVIAGLYRGRTLKGPAGNITRPTSDRLRETLFNVIAPNIGADTRFLDLCAGTGAIGIEAISRSAAFVTFVDISRRACALIEENLDRLEVPESQTEIISLPAETFTARTHPLGWDIVYFDPPYKLDHALVLREIGMPGNSVLNDEGILIVEHHARTAMPDAVLELRRWRILKQGDSSLSFYERS
jgi:16S rRNA (guanine966-N2)-methyltransferase